MNINTINSIPMNTSTIAYTLIPIPDGLLIFNDQELCKFSEGVAALTTNKFDLPNFSLVSYKSPLTDNGGVSSHLIVDRDLEFQVYIKGTDAEDFGNKVQAFKKKIVRQEGLLLFKIGSQSLQCTASVTEFKRTTVDSPYSSTFSLKFKSLTNYTDGVQTQLSYLGIIANFQGGIVNLGHRESDLSIVMSFTNAISLNQVIVIVNGYPIEINETINPNDILSIDSINGKVQINAIDVEYDGLLPSILTNPGQNGFNAVEFQFNAGSTVDTNIFLFYLKQLT